MTLEQLEAKLRARALQYPETYEEMPWGERVVKVKGKVALFMGTYRDKLHLTVKLPVSKVQALTLPFAEPAGYNLGKAGWVSASFERAADVPLDLVHAWIDESYRAVAPKTLVKTLPASGPPAKRAADPAPSVQLSGRVLLVGEDPLRLERARKLLEGCGMAVMDALLPVPETLDRILDERPDHVVMDISRNAPASIEMVRALSEATRKPPAVWFAGVRDAAQEKVVTGVGALVHGAARTAPGETSFAELMKTKSGPVHKKASSRT